MTTRRLIIGGGAAALVAPGSFAGTKPHAIDPAEVALVQWLNGCCALNAKRGACTEEEWDEVYKIERRICDAAPSIDAAAARLLHEIAYLVDGFDHSLSGFMADDDRLPFDILRSLRPYVSGRLAHLSSDLLDNPDRKLSESLIGRAFDGEQPL